MNQVSIDKRKLVDNELNPDESLRWCAEPDPARHAKKGIPLFLKGIFFTAFAVFWMYAASGFNMPLFSAAGLRPFPLFGLPFFLIGLWMLLTPLWNYIKAKKTVYAITNKRVIIFEGIFNIKIRSYTGKDVMASERNQMHDGTGDIVLKREYYPNQSGNRSNIKLIGLFGIKNVKEVDYILDELRKNV